MLAVLKQRMVENETRGIPERDGTWHGSFSGSNKEVVMHRVGRIGFMGLGIALAGCLIGAPVFAGDKPAKAPVEDGSKVMITSP